MYNQNVAMKFWNPVSQTTKFSNIYPSFAKYRKFLTLDFAKISQNFDEKNYFTKLHKQAEIHKYFDEKVKNMIFKLLWNKENNLEKNLS
jgi:hypothetical protein